MKKRKKILLISSSGGHYEQLKSLKDLGDTHDLTWITEKTKYESKSDYYLLQIGSRDYFFIPKLIYNFFKSLVLFLYCRPDVVITTGAAVSVPLILISKLFNKKLIFIETFARVYDGTKTGKFAYRFSDLFIVQWEELLRVYPNAVYGGSIY